MLLPYLYGLFVLEDPCSPTQFTLKRVQSETMERIELAHTDGCTIPHFLRTSTAFVLVPAAFVAVLLGRLGSKVLQSQAVAAAWVACSACRLRILGST